MKKNKTKGDELCINCGGPLEPELLKEYREAVRRYDPDDDGYNPSPPIPFCRCCIPDPVQHEDLRPLFDLLAALPGVLPSQAWYSHFSQPVVAFEADTLGALARVARLAVAMTAAGLFVWNVRETSWHPRTGLPGAPPFHFRLEGPMDHAALGFKRVGPGDRLDGAKLAAWARRRLAQVRDDPGG
jgi:hypothetical protein